MTRGRRGRFIVLEGLDGAGTTTQTQRLAHALREQGHHVVTTREPSDGPIGTLIRQALGGRLGLPNGDGPLTHATLALLFAADRTDHLAATVEPAVAQGSIVLSDRYVLSSLAYQGVELPMAWVAEINQHAVAPDLTLFLQVPSAVGAKRRAIRGGRPELFEARRIQRKVEHGYELALQHRSPHENIERIDGSLPMERITDLALERVQTLLKKAPRGRRQR